METGQSSESTKYRVYTTKFDKVVHARELASVLGPVGLKDSKKLDEAWHELQMGLLPWRTKLHVASRQFSESIRDSMSREQRGDTVVSLLFDQSGSMRGQKMLYSAATADIAQEFLKTLGITCEILGFTTASWHGGDSRKRWKWRFRPRNPGRLNDLLHVIFSGADEKGAATGGWIYRQMLRPDYAKENIDGEAIEWAASRLRDIGKSRKILIVLSDGAPVDDSTLRENGDTYLGDHLRSVVEALKSEGEIEIAGFGIGFAVNLFYPVAHSVDDPSELGIELLRLVTELLIEDEQPVRAG